MIQDMQQVSKETVSKMELFKSSNEEQTATIINTEQIFNQIHNSVDTINRKSIEINNSLNIVDQSKLEMKDTLDSISATSQQTFAEMEEINSSIYAINNSSKELSNLTLKLNDVVSEVKTWAL